MYAVAPQAAPEAVRALETACRTCGRFIPEVLDGAVGWNRSEAPVQLVWEHAYESPEAYRRYMVHPFHASVLDRYLLHDSPERVVVADTMGAGLIGYHCDEPSYRMTQGVRRLVLLRLDPGAAQDDVGRLEQALCDGRTEVRELTVSVAAANTLGAAWFDGLTPVGPPPRWTHVWEQGFPSLEAFESYRTGGSVLATAERQGWKRHMGEIVTRAADVFYQIVPGG
jgi:hypothetical protein